MDEKRVVTGPEPTIPGYTSDGQPYTPADAPVYAGRFPTIPRIVGPKGSDGKPITMTHDPIIP